MKYLTSANVKLLSQGAALLGSGGGGDTDILKPLVLEQLNKFGPIAIISVEELSDNACIIPLAFIGSPAVTKARGADPVIFTKLLEAIKRDYPDRALVLMPAEIGGCNALTPFLIAAQLSVPVLDADLIGRAFPKVSMCKPAINHAGSSITAYLSGYLRECQRITANNTDELELVARSFTNECGGSALIATFLCNANQVETMALTGSISQAILLGEALVKNEMPSTVEPIARGVVSHIQSKNENGFFIGKAEIKSGFGLLSLYFQNEFLCLRYNETILAESPTIIALLNPINNTPIAAESLLLNQDVVIVTLNAPSFWLTHHALPAVSLDKYELTT
jgi:DUF917 family protein